MARYYLGVDGGGTKTAVLCANDKGEIVGTGASGPTNLTSTSVGAASFNLLEAIRQATEQLPDGGLETNSHEITNLVMGLAGVDTAQEQHHALEVFKEVLKSYRIQNFVLLNDSLIALANASDSANAIVLVSGTGTVCYGKNARGQIARTSGLDFLLSDQGSGYYIGRQVLREAVKSFDGRRTTTLLENMVCQFFHIQSIEDLKHKVYNPILTKIEVASLAPLCTTAYGLGDESASVIFEHAIEELVLQAVTVIRKLEFGSEQFDCVFAGSVMKIDHVRDQVLRRLQEQFSNLQLKVAEKDPVYGAIKMALRTVV